VTEPASIPPAGRRLAAVVIAIVLLPGTALANMGTPLMWAGYLHLMFGNAVLGVIEASLLLGLFGPPRRFSVYVVMVIANYASAWFGVTLSNWPAPEVTIENLRAWFVMCVAISFMLTIAIELPFVWWSLRGSRGGWRRAIVATLVLHAISYPALAGWYFAFSRTSLLTAFDVVAPAQLVPKSAHVLLWVATDGQRVMRSDLAGSPGEVVATLPPEQRAALLVATSNDKGGADLSLRAWDDDRAPATVLLRDVGQIPHAPSARENGGADPGPIVRMIPWSYDGAFEVRDPNGGTTWVGLETPFVAWNVRSPVVIESDLVLFELGSDQICLLQPSTRRIALLARGSRCVVVDPPARTPR